MGSFHQPDQILLVCIEGIVAFLQDLANALLLLLVQKRLPRLAVHGDLGTESGQRSLADLGCLDGSDGGHGRDHIPCEITAGVVNKLGEVGAITAFDAKYITVDYPSRTAQLLTNAFEQGHIRYVNTDLQKKIEEEIAQVKLEAAQKAEEARIAAENKKQAQKGQVAKVPVSNKEITFESVKLMLEPARYSLNSVAKPDKALVGDIFEQCNRDIQELYEKTNPRMTYPKITSHSRSLSKCISINSSFS